MKDLGSLLDLADLAIARCEGVVSQDVRGELASVVHRARRRHGFVGEALVVAFAGGTGSGKSSLVNAVVGEPIAQVGVLRPTTDAALAVTPRDLRVDLTPLLNDIGVTERVESDALGLWVLVDLPDFDSTVTSHRRIVEDVLPRVDAVVWVFDPEKYADATIHTRFLSNLTGYESQFLFALNQTDRLGSSAATVHGDLLRMLLDDGFRDPEVVSTVARGPELDVSHLVEALSQRLDVKRTVMRKLATDLRVAASRGWEETRDGSVNPDRDQGGADGVALAAATFVLLGVEAIVILEGGAEG